jgi:hypothetical protein
MSGDLGLERPIEVSVNDGVFEEIAGFESTKEVLL